MTIQVAANGVGLYDDDGSVRFRGGHLQIVYGTQEIECYGPNGASQLGYFVGTGNFQYVGVHTHTASTTQYYEVPGAYTRVNLNLNGRNSSDVWNLLSQLNSEFSAKGGGISYRVLDQNSNSYVATLLWSVGVDLNYSIPSQADRIPAVSNNLLLSYDSISLNLNDTSGNDIIRGGYSDDTFTFSGGGNDTVSGGFGDDTFRFNSSSGQLTIKKTYNSYFFNEYNGDKIIAKGITLKGPLIPEEDCPEDEEPDEEPYENEDGVLGPDGERYKLSGGDVIVTLKTGEKITVEQFTNKDFGWEFYEGDREVAIYNGAACFADPIVIDLDGDGVEFTALEAGKSFFDYDGDGFGERTAWASSDDGFLAVDLDGDGKITTAAELFAEEPTVGFDALAAYDSNTDGVINADDAGYADLRIWQDADSDGITDDGELRTLAEAGIASIDLAGATDGGSTSTVGVNIRKTSTVTLDDGATRDVASVDFRFDNHSSRYLTDVEVDPTLADLPGLNGYGNVRDLDVAMTEDTVLRKQVEALDGLTAADAASFGQAVEAMILRWHRVEDVVEDGRGEYVDARHIAAMEAYAGEEYSNSFVTGRPNAARADAGAALQTTWDIYHSNVTARVLAQTELGQELFPELHYYSQLSLELDAGTSVTMVMDHMATHAPEDTFENLSFWRSMALVVQATRDQFVEQGDAFLAAANAVLSANGVEYDFDKLRTARIGLDGGEVIVGHGWDGESVQNNNGVAFDDLIVSGTGDDLIKDAGGENTLIYGAGRGNDTLEVAWSDTWTIDLVGLNPADIEVSISPIVPDVVLTIASTGETLTIQNVVRNGVVRTLIKVQFADGSEGVIGEGDLGPQIEPTDGNDELVGTDKDETIEGGAGDDTAAGGGGSDTYVIGEGDGNDVVVEDGSDNQATDTILLDAPFADVTVSYVYSSINSDSDNLKLTLADGTSVTILQTSRDSSPIERFEFTDVTLSYDELRAIRDQNGTIVTGNDGDNILANSAADEIFLGREGSDAYSFGLGSGSDVIYDVPVSGEINTLTIAEDYANVRFGLNAGNITMTLTDGSSLLIIDGEDNPSIGQFVFNDQSVDEAAVRARAEIETLTLFGTDGDDSLVADDVSQYSYEENTLIGGLGNDHLDGGDEADTYIYNLGDGNDTINDDGRSASDDGVRVEIDKLIIHGISPDDVTISRVEDDNDDLVLTFAATGETITIQDQLENRLPSGLGITPPPGSSTYSSVGSSEIEQIVFDDGTVWTVDDVQARLLAEASTDGDDTVNGFDESDDTIEAGLGDDTVSGLEGSDTIIFNLGDGNDAVNESVSGEGTDTLKLVGIDPAGMVATKDGNDLVLTFTSSPSDSIRLVSQLSTYSFGYRATQVIERVEFDNGTVLSDSDLSDLAFQALATSASETINGTNDAENLFMSDGDDTLIGGRGNDVYVRAAGVSGDDRIDDGGINSFDTIRFEDVLSSQITVTLDGEDVIFGLPSGSVTIVGQQNSLGWNVIERIEFADGEVWNKADITAAFVTASGMDALVEGDALDNTLTGTAADETLDGKAGNDDLSGGSGSDLYVFTRGSDNDRIADSGDDTRYSVDRVELTGINPDEVTLSRIANNEIQITINDTGETLVLEGIYQNNNDAIEFVEFADGTVWDRDYLIENAWWRGTDGDDTITASQYYNNIVHGGKGSDALDGGYATSSNAPTFIFNVGDGIDTVNNFGRDATILINGVTASDISFEVDLLNGDEDTLIIRYSPTDHIEVYRQLYDGYSQYGIATLRLDDGTEFDASDFVQAIATGTASADTIDGSSRDDVIEGLAGDDTIDGNGGSDIYLWSLGDGNDTITGSSEAPENNTLKFTDLASSDVTLSRDGDNLLATVNSSGEFITIEDQFSRYSASSAYGVGQIVFSDDVVISRTDLERQHPDDQSIRNIFGTSGDDTMQGTASADVIETGDGDDTLDGLAGDDELDGGNESDVYLWRPGSGNDVIDDSGYRDGDIDTIRIENANFADFTIGRSPDNGSDLRLTYNPTGETLTLSYQLQSWNDNIERIEFADGPVLSGDDLKANYPYVGTAEADTLISSDYDSDDIFQGLEGDDQLAGGFGSDTYLWQVGDGNDTIIEPSPLSGGGQEPEGGKASGEGDVNVLRLSGVVESDITFQREGNSPNLMVVIGSSGEQIRLQDQLSVSEGLIQKIVLDDGTELSLAGLAGILPIIGTDNEDYLEGGSAGETFDAKLGDDVVESGEGSDTIVWQTGDGNDVVYDLGQSADQDVLHLIDVAPDGIQLTRGTASSDDLSGDPTVDDLIVIITATGETILVRDQFALGDEFTEWDQIPGIEQIEFSNGSTLSRSQLAEQLDMSGGIVGGTDGDDVLEGDSGNNVLAGGEGNDAYQFDRGAAEDIIVDSGGDSDFVEFGTGVTPESLTLQRIGDDLLIEVGGVERLTLTIVGQFDEYYDQSIEGIRFADGLEWSADDIKAILINENTTNGDDTIVGFDGDDVIRTLGGNDLIIVGDGNDIVDGGEGYDIVELDGSSWRFDVETTETGYIVTDTYTDEVKHLTNVEAIRFSYGDDLVLEENSAPTTGTVSINGYEDRAITILASDILSEAADADGESLSLVSVSDAINGTVALDADGNVVFTPDAEFSGEVSFAYEITDGTHTVSDTATITIEAVNDAPIVANPIADQDGTEDTPFNFVIPEDTFSDVDSSELTLSATLADGAELPDWLEFDPATRTFTGNPPENFNGILPVVVIASDGAASVSTSFAFNLAPVNDAPIAFATIDDKAVEADEPANIVLPVDAFVDVDGDTLLYSATLSDGSDLPEWLSIDPFTGEMTGTPPSGTDETYSITITASDGSEEATSSFDLTIDSGNQTPTVDNPITDQSSAEDEAISFTIPADTFSDPDGDTLSVTALLADGSALPDWLSFDGDTRTFSGTPPKDFNGSVDVTVTASDGALETSDTFTLEITPVNDAPIVANEIADQSSEEDNAVSFLLPENTFSDVDGDELTLTAALVGGATLPLWLTFDAAAREFSGTPPQDFNGTLDVTVTASDGELETSDTFTLEITPANDAPIVFNPIADQISAEDQAVSFALPENSFSDVDGDTLNLSALLADGSTLPGWLSFDGDTRTFSGIPPQDFNGSLDVTVTASDGELEASDTFALEITPVNDAPVVANALNDQTSNEDTNVSFTLPADTFEDVDSDALTLSAALSDSTALPDWLSFDGDTRTFSGTPPQDFDGTLDVTVSASDGEFETSDTFALEITPVNDAPVAANDSGFEATSGETVTISAVDLLANDSDVDGDTLTVTAVSSTSGNATVSLDTGGNIVYEAADGFEGTDTFEYTISDGELTSTASVSISVEGSDNPYEGWQQGTDGNDWLFGNNLFGSNQIYGAGGNDRIFGGFRSDEIDGGTGNDRLFGLWGNDILNGNEGNDRIFGGAGRDTISGGEGNDRLWGGWGQDNFVFKSGDGRDRIMDFDTGRGWWGRYHSNGDSISINVEGVNSFDDLMDVASQRGHKTVFDFGDGDKLILSHTRLAALDQDAFTFF